MWAFGGRGLFLTKNIYVMKKYLVSYATKPITKVYANSKWDAMNKVYEDNITRFSWIERCKLKATLSRD